MQPLITSPSAPIVRSRNSRRDLSQGLAAPWPHGSRRACWHDWAGPDPEGGRMADAVADALSRLVPGGVTRGGLVLGDRTVRWVEAGGRGHPTVILEAGRNDAAITWAPVMTALAPRAHAVAYDRAGLGASDPAPVPVTLDRQVADLAAVIGQTAPGPCVLAGHSWGGMLVQMLACRHPSWSRDLYSSIPHTKTCPPSFRAQPAGCTASPRCICGPLCSRSGCWRSSSAGGPGAQPNALPAIHSPAPWFSRRTRKARAGQTSYRASPQAFR
jgi:pimeloyl-ACP methyl ester carboxylesterase